ncbi:single-stranded DNA-binding protein [Angustibacter sp. McL0619]|uniref:single-stranded DNA-binding protein n=1 Tax=Angustibacter sp. McL0619 TaxID=3415676 RepID=UPI003CEF8549
MNEIVTTVSGNIATVPKHQITAKGQAMTSFRLASTPRKFDQDVQGYVDGETTWVNVSCWGALAFNASKSLQKGQPVTVHGAMRQREWVADDGKTGKELELAAQTIGHDLRRGCAEFQKVTRGPSAERRFGPASSPSAEPHDAADVDLSQHDQPAIEPSVNNSELEQLARSA